METGPESAMVDDLITLFNQTTVVEHTFSLIALKNQINFVNGVPSTPEQDVLYTTVMKYEKLFNVVTFAWFKAFGENTVKIGYGEVKFALNPYKITSVNAHKYNLLMKLLKFVTYNTDDRYSLELIQGEDGPKTEFELQFPKPGFCPISTTIELLTTHKPLFNLVVILGTHDGGLYVNKKVMEAFTPYILANKNLNQIELNETEEFEDDIIPWIKQVLSIEEIGRPVFVDVGWLSLDEDLLSDLFPLFLKNALKVGYVFELHIPEDDSYNGIQYIFDEDVKKFINSIDAITIAPNLEVLAFDTYLNVSIEVFTEMFQVFEYIEFPKLQVINLCGNYLSIDLMKIVCRIICRNPSIEQLVLNATCLDDSIMDTIVNGLKGCAALKKFEATNCGGLSMSSVGKIYELIKTTGLRICEVDSQDSNINIVSFHNDEYLKKVKGLCAIEMEDRSLPLMTITY